MSKKLRDYEFGPRNPGESLSARMRRVDKYSSFMPNPSSFGAAPSPANPKDVEALTKGKTRLDLLEPVAERQIADALAFGADKYGVRNYVTSPIKARVYIAAMKRHIDAWLEGEEYAEDSGCHHLAHVGANVHVALAAIAAGSFVDDRPAHSNKNPINTAATVEGE